MVQSTLPDGEGHSASPPKPGDSPEARRQAVLAGGHLETFHSLLGPHSRFFTVIRRVAVGCFNDGSIHAGNLAYMSLLAIFPFFITAGAVYSMFVAPGESAATIDTVAAALPPLVAGVIEPVAREAVAARSGWLLWAGAAVGVWTAGSLVETIRDILHRSYGTAPTQPFWKYRVGSIGIILGAVTLLILSLYAQVTVAAARHTIAANLPQLSHALNELALSRLVTALGVYLSILMLFLALTPSAYRGPRYRKWPGALLIAVWWLVVAELLPPVLRRLFTYDLTYGSLAGVMIDSAMRSAVASAAEVMMSRLPA